MAAKSWAACLDDLKPYIYKINTPDASGTGFQITFAPTEKLVGIATALHVVWHAHNWEEPIKLVHHGTGKSIIVRAPERVIFTYPDKDLAFILLVADPLPVNDGDLSLIAPDMRTRQGVHMGIMINVNTAVRA